MVTNAHVVAGAAEIAVTPDAGGGRTRSAVAVLFDPRLDIALLHVPGLRTGGLVLATREPDRGEPAAALGHPSGGGLAMIPAAVAATYRASGRDLYGESTVDRGIDRDPGRHRSRGLWRPARPRGWDGRRCRLRRVADRPDGGVRARRGCRGCDGDPGRGTHGGRPDGPLHRLKPSPPGSPQRHRPGPVPAPLPPDSPGTIRPMTHDHDPADAAALDALARDYWEAVLEDEPLFATQIGERRYDDRLRDPSPAGRAAWRARLEALLAREASLGETNLDPEARVTRSALHEALRSDLAHLRTGVDDWTVDPLEGPQVEFLNLESYQPVRSFADGAAMVARWRAMGPYVDATIANLRRALGGGRVAVRTPSSSRSPSSTTASPSPTRSGRCSVRRAPTTRTGPTPSAPSSARSSPRRCATAVRPGARALPGRPRGEILPGGAARTTARGSCTSPGGADVYRELIRVHTSLDLAAEELHATGLAEVARIDAEMVALGERVLGTTDLGETLERLRDDPALHFATRERDRGRRPRRSLARAKRGARRLVRPPPAGRLRGRARWARTRRSTRTIAYYRQPAPDGSRPGQYYVNTSAPATRPRYEAEALAFHEAIPGHHLQIAIAQELDGHARVPQATGADRLLRGLGALHRAARRRDGPLLRRSRPLRHALVRRLARLPAGGRHRAARPGLDPAARRSTSWASNTALAREQHRQRGGPLHRLARPGARLQDRPARDPPAARRGAGARSARASTSAPSTTRSSAAGRSRWRRCARS